MWVPDGVLLKRKRDVTCLKTKTAGLLRIAQQAYYERLFALIIVDTRVKKSIHNFDRKKSYRKKNLIVK